MAGNNRKQFKVISNHNALVTLEFVPDSSEDGLVPTRGGCATCTAAAGCASKQRQVTLAATAVGDCQPGDILSYEHADHEVMRAALLGYGAPLAGLLSGAVLGQLWAGELTSIIAGLVGMILPVLFLR